MIDLRPFASLGAANHGWLDARHHFSFASYLDPSRMGWGAIRVWNDDTIAGGSGFPPHPHSDMEIVTFVRSGAISHRDSLGNEGRTAAGDVQVMSAGSGITHAEFNREDEATTLFQIWILPDRRGGDPQWGQREFPRSDRSGAFTILASGEAKRNDALEIRADARVAAATLGAGQTARWNTDPARHQYLVAPKGRITVNRKPAEPRDGIAVTGEDELIVEALDDAEIVLVDAR
ncbi:pirin family protein [Altererythrobacter sp. SALINAS58]|uniref:pirin family protein n=1 Tax=Alteripontixanthobacter muriae TaxID=2705546 RepID=UPI0015771E32|nr:pirin family protein [Alteripontixanthobacter muriae]NTZ41919.1 pirin family protein [Alteripontixanthobacter muriae]